MRLYSILGILVLTIIGFWACQYSFEQDKKDEEITLELVLGQIASQDSIFTFLAEEGFTYKFATGTEINIPGGALMGYSGEVINGPVILTFSAFRDAIDLLAAGIMMDSGAGLNKTAGAIKIEVEQAGKKLILDPSQSIAVKLACYEKEADYGLYYFKAKDNHWEYLYATTPTINQPHVQLEIQERRMKPRIKFPLEEEYFALNYKGILDVIYNDKLTNVNHKQTQKKMEKYGLRWPNVNVDTLVQYNGKRVFATALIWQNISRKPFPEWTKNERGRLEKINNNRFRLIVANKNGSKKFSTQVEAVMHLEKLFSYGPGYWKYDYFSKLKLVSATQNELQAMPNAFRSFRIHRFGIFNWQKTVEEVASVKINAQLKQNGNSFSGKEFPGFYYLTGDSKGLTYHPFSQWNDFTLFSDPEARIFLVSPNRELWLSTSEMMKKIDIDQLKKMSNPSFIFKIVTTNRKPDSVEDLREAIFKGL